MEDTLASQLTALANNLRKKYNKTTSLTIADMVRLTTPPALQMELLQQLLRLVRELNIVVMVQLNMI